jgi:hypothetical protein
MATYIGETQGNYVNGAKYDITTADMTGKVFESPEDLDGKKDERIMLYASSSYQDSWLYKVYNTAEELLRRLEFFGELHGFGKAQ